MCIRDRLYKDGASKGKDVDYSGNVVISVVKEDIVFEVCLLYTSRCV